MAYWLTKVPAGGSPLPHVPSDSPGRLIHKYASACAPAVAAVGGVPSARPLGLHQSSLESGAGPAPDSGLNWCNPSGRGLGTAPTTATAGAHADAYLWIKRPGESDGTCDKGDPPAGTFVSQYAIDLAHKAG